MGKMKDIFMEQQTPCNLDENHQAALAESLRCFEKAIHFSTQILDEAVEWKEVVLDLRQYTGVAPSPDENTCVLLHGSNSIIIHSPFNTVYDLWKKVR